MSNDKGWGSQPSEGWAKAVDEESNNKWPSSQIGKLNTEPMEWPSGAIIDEVTPINPKWFEPKLYGWDLGTGDKTITALVKDGKIEKVYNNKVPTHDPYTNPDTHVYYQCACGAILDPGTKSFASLNNHASLVGWKIRFGPQHYIPYCVKCGEGVE